MKNTILLIFASLLILLFISKVSYTILLDCDDDNPNIFPAQIENCADKIDNNCNMNNSINWDNDAKTGIDCFDTGCAGKPGAMGIQPVICCQSALDCSSLIKGDCGIAVCNSNHYCEVIKQLSLCTTKGQCGVSSGTCTPTPQFERGYAYNSYSCDWADDISLCNCDQICNGTPGYTCVNLSINKPPCCYTYNECVTIASSPISGKEPNQISQCLCHALFENQNCTAV